MADLYLLAGLTLPQGVAHESLPGTVTRFMSDCWHGMSRTHMIARAKRRVVPPSRRGAGFVPAEGGNGTLPGAMREPAGSAIGGHAVTHEVATRG